MSLIKVKGRGAENLGRRNLVINGNMKIAQRGAGPTQVTNSAYFGPDRYRFFINGGGAYTVTQDSGHQADTGHDKALKIAVTTADTSIAAGDYYTFLQRIESNSLQHLQYGTSSAKSLTLSFWVRATKTGTQVVFFSKQGTGQDYNHIKEYTINASNTWEHKTITIPGLTASTMANDASTYLQFGFMLKYGSDFQGTKDTWTTNSHFTTANAVNNMDSTSNTFYVTGVQLEVGDTATDFEHRSFEEELRLCSRYYRKIGRHMGGGREGYSASAVTFYPGMRLTGSGAANIVTTLTTGGVMYSRGGVNNSTGTLNGTVGISTGATDQAFTASFSHNGASTGSTYNGTVSGFYVDGLTFDAEL